MGKVLQFKARQRLTCRRCGKLGMKEEIESMVLWGGVKCVDQSKTKQWKHFLSGWEEITVMERRLVKVRHRNYWHTPYYHCYNCREHNLPEIIQMHVMLKKFAQLELFDT